MNHYDSKKTNNHKTLVTPIDNPYNSVKASHPSSHNKLKLRVEA